ncbi:MAG: TonB-dependent receptor plug domain-containing protein, partial [Pseudomonadota bacterium]
MKHLKLGVATIALLITIGVANGQETSNLNDNSQSDVIVVIGSKLGLTEQESTDSIELLTANRLGKDSIFELSDALSRTPNVSVVGGTLTNINIRGINREGTGGAGQGEAVNIFLDGAPLSSDAILGSDSIWDVSQVEVLRGSQSILQGRNAIAGAIVLETNKPTFDWEGAARVRVAEFGTHQFAGVISGPIIKDQLAFRFSADFDETEGAIANANTSDKDNSQENLTIRGKLLAVPNAIERLSALLTVEY